MKFNDFKESDFKVLGRSLEKEMKLGDIMLIPINLVSMSDQEVNDVIKKMNQEILPEDYVDSMARQLLLLSCLNVL